MPIFCNTCKHYRYKRYYDACGMYLDSYHECLRDRKWKRVGYHTDWETVEIKVKSCFANRKGNCKYYEKKVEADG